jgi:hypothetical protein
VETLKPLRTVLRMEYHAGRRGYDYKILVLSCGCRVVRKGSQKTPARARCEGQSGKP